ncbi:MAG: hypothetical protein VCC04_07980 [Myxococcota bacterium]
MSRTDQAGRIALPLLLILTAGVASGNTLESPELVPEVAAAWERDFDVLEPASWLVELRPSESIEVRRPHLRPPPPIEFPPEEFSFVLVGYTREIRVIDIDMFMRLEAPGVDRSLVSLEFIF